MIYFRLDLSTAITELQAVFSKRQKQIRDSIINKPPKNNVYKPKSELQLR
jgi:hypothetical protein